MKDTSARVAHSLLLAVSLIFTSASAQVRAQSPARVAPPAAVTSGAFEQLTSQAELDTLSRNGPAIPTEFNGNEIRFRGLFRWDWTLTIVYELTQPGTVTMKVVVDGHNHDISFTSKQQVPGAFHRLSAQMRHVCTIPLPGGIGGATYSIRAVTERPPAPGEPALLIRIIAAGPPNEGAALGDRVVSPPEGFAQMRGARLMEAAYGFAPQGAGAPPPLGLTTPAFTPRSIRVVGGRPEQSAAYRFRVTLPFNRVKVQIKQYSGNRWGEVSLQNFGPGLEADSTINGTWDCMKDGAPSIGKHMLWVTASRTRAEDGRFSLITSEPVVIVPGF